MIFQRGQLPITQITIDSEIQPRAELNQEVVDEYAEAMRFGTIFPAVIVFYDGTSNWLADGFHRIEAAKLAQLTEISTEICSGTRREAILYAVGANTTHGLRRTNADKRRAVEQILQDKEWNQWSDREIARICRVSNSLVSCLRKKINLSVILRQRENSSEVHDFSTQRLIRRNGKVQIMDTAKIGKTNGQSLPIQITDPSPNSNLSPDQEKSLISLKNDGIAPSYKSCLGKTPTASHQFCILEAEVDGSKINDQQFEIYSRILITGSINAWQNILTQMQVNPDFAEDVLEQAERRARKSA